MKVIEIDSCFCLANGCYCDDADSLGYSDNNNKDDDYGMDCGYGDDDGEDDCEGLCYGNEMATVMVIA